MSFNPNAAVYQPTFMMNRPSAAALSTARLSSAAAGGAPPLTLPKSTTPMPPQPASVPAPAPAMPPPVTRPKISVTRTGVNTVSPMPGGLHLTPGSGGVAQTPPRPQAPPSPATVLSSERSPAVLAHSVPTRMSPFIGPRHNMNPNAEEFRPRHPGMAHHGEHINGHSVGGTSGGLEVLPSSTADIEQSKASANTAATAAAAHGPCSSVAVAAAPAKPPAPGAAAQRSEPPSPAVHPIRLDNKSAMEIEEISKKSALKVSAALYVPQRTIARVVLAQPSPQTLAPSGGLEESGVELIFNDLWTLFYLPSTWGENIKEEDYNPILVFRIDSIPTFWRVLNNIPTPTEMSISTLYLFRDGIDPRWEDKANRSGGIVKVKVTADQVDEAWELLMCRTTGDSWSVGVGETVNGVVLKVRERAYWLELWVTKDSPELQADLAELWKSVMGDSFVTLYVTHAILQGRAQTAAANAAEKQKKNRRRF